MNEENKEFFQKQQICEESDKLNQQYYEKQHFQNNQMLEQMLKLQQNTINIQKELEMVAQKFLNQRKEIQNLEDDLEHEKETERKQEKVGFVEGLKEIEKRLTENEGIVKQQLIMAISQIVNEINYLNGLLGNKKWIHIDQQPLILSPKSMTFNKSEQFIAISGSNKVQIWGFHQNQLKLLQQLEGLSKEVKYLSFNRKDDSLLTSSEANAIIWQKQDNKWIRLQQLESSFGEFSFSGNFLISFNKMLNIWQNHQSMEWVLKQDIKAGNEGLCVSMNEDDTILVLGSNSQIFIFSNSGNYWQEEEHQNLAKLDDLNVYEYKLHQQCEDQDPFDSASYCQKMKMIAYSQLDYTYFFTLTENQEQTYSDVIKIKSLQTSFSNEGKYLALKSQEHLMIYKNGNII